MTDRSHPDVVQVSTRPMTGLAGGFPLTTQNRSVAAWRNMTTQNHTVCHCGGRLRWIDTHKSSVTAQCRRCRYCSLVVGSSGCRQVIRLADFHLKRGDGSGQRRLAEITTAEHIAACVAEKEWPSQGALVYYGIDSGAHLDALHHAVTNGITAYDLDRVEGDGPAITKLVHSVSGQFWKFIAFSTAFDGYAEMIALNARRS